MKKTIIILSVVMGVFISMTATAITQLKSKINEQNELINEQDELIEDLVNAQQEINDIFAKQLGLD